jgi:hypothetical protein
VKKGSVVMVYDAFGRLAAEYGGTADPVGTEYLTADHLGSTRLVTSSTGAERLKAAWKNFEMARTLRLVRRFLTFRRG